MDHERTEMELQEIFEEIQRSYEIFVDNAFSLQERTLGLARILLEGSAQSTQRTQSMLEDLTNESRSQRQRFEILTRKSTEAYMRVLNAPTDEHHHKVEEAKADLEEASPS